MIRNDKKAVRQWIADALLRLLEKYDYDSITIQNIVDEAKIGRRTFYRYFSSKDALLTDTIQMYMSRLGDYFKENLSGRAEDVSFYYFSYWEQNIDFLRIMQKAGLTYRISEHFEEAVHAIAQQLGHIPSHADRQSVMEYYEKYKFAFGFRLAGYWRVTELWAQENPRRSAEEMSMMINAILGERADDQLWRSTAGY